MLLEEKDLAMVKERKDEDNLLDGRKVRASDRVRRWRGRLSKQVTISRDKENVIGGDDSVGVRVVRKERSRGRL